MWTAKATALLISAVILTLVAWNTGIILFYVAVVLIACLLLGSFFLSLCSLPHLNVQHITPDAAYEGEDLRIEVHIKNMQLISRFFLRIRDHISSLSPTGSPPEHIIPSIKRLGTYIWTYMSTSYQRGKHTIGPLMSITGDPFGIFAWKRLCGRSHNVVIYPQVFKIAYFPRPSRGIIPWLGLETGHHAGESGDFYGIREYRQGDSIKRIHWKSVARSTRLTVKQYERSSADEITILLDLNQKTNVGFGREKVSEYAIRIAASLTRYLVQKGTMVQFAANIAPVQHTPFGKGDTHYYSVLEQLAAINPKGNMSMNDLIQEMSPLIPPHSSVVVIIPDVEYATTWSLVDCAKRFVTPIVITLDVASFSQFESVPEHEKIRSQMKETRGFAGRLLRVRQGDDLEKRFGEFSWT